jgi:hypothetical protein
VAKFQQPVNRQAQLIAVLDGYEAAIQRTTWLSEAFQKDGIQNAWGARTNAKGLGWEVKLLHWKDFKNNYNYVFIEDSGTFGLTGIVPKDIDEETRILQSRDGEQRLGRFLSSDWSEKTDFSLGSRGRGKMIFVGASELSSMLFESIRSSDNKYVFGRTFLDKNKVMQVEILESREAHLKREELLGTNFPKLNHIGTRVIIPKPKKELVDPIVDLSISDAIQVTWWEIIHKFQAKIWVGEYGSPKLVPAAEWLPVEISGLSKIKHYQNIEIDKGLKIKRISLAYLQDKELPLNYQGIAVQRGGMNIQMVPSVKFIPEILEGKIYGSVEFEKPLDEAMLELESPEHYSFFWHKGVAHRVNKEIKKTITQFAKEFKILKDERQATSKAMREAELAIQKELNDIAKSLGLSGRGFGTRTKRPPRPIPPNEELIQISIPDFRTPNPSGKVEINQNITGALADGFSGYDEQLKVSFQIYVYREGGHSVAGLSETREGIVGKGIPPLRVGWDEITIDERFEKGHYFLRAKMISLEDRILSASKSVEKGDILYHEVSRPFWVDEDPPEKGFFKDTRAAPRGREKYVWYEDDDGYVLYYNNEHPLLKDILADNDVYADVLRKEGTLILWTIILGTAIAEPEALNQKILKLTEGVKDLSLEGQVEWLLSRRSESLWGK